MNTLLIEPEPVTNPTALSTAPRRLLDPVEPRARILYVDDDASIRRLGELALARSGYDVDTAADSAEAWEALQNAHYNLLITDHDMPGLTGSELATHARLAEMRLPIVMTSGNLDALHDPSTAWLGLAARLPKPFGTDALLATVEHALHAANNLRPLNDEAMAAFEPIADSDQPIRHWGINE